MSGMGFTALAASIHAARLLVASGAFAVATAGVASGPVGRASGPAVGGGTSGLAVSTGRAAATCAPDSVYSDAWDAMGSRFSIELVAESRNAAEMALVAARDEVERVEQLLSDYRPTSALSRINRDRIATIDPEFFFLLTRTADLVEATGGAFDPAVGSLVDAWGFRSGRPAIPTDSLLARLVAESGWSHVRLEEEEKSVALGSPTVRLDPGAFGKGYAAERVADVLIKLGVRCALVNAGASTFRALGPPPGASGWRVRIAGTDPLAEVRLAHESLSVSGASGRSFERDGRRYGHILDPRTGHPAPADRIVAVRSPSALDSDALSTALYVAGPEAGRNILGRFPGASALFIEGARGVRTSLGPWEDAP